VTWQQDVPAAVILKFNFGRRFEPERCDEISRSN